MMMTDRAIGRAIASAARHGHISQSDAKKVAEILEDAAMGVGMEAGEMADFGRRRILEHRANLLMAIADAIEAQIEAKSTEAGR